MAWICYCRVQCWQWVGQGLEGIPGTTILQCRWSSRTLDSPCRTQWGHYCLEMTDELILEVWRGGILKTWRFTFLRKRKYFWNLFFFFLSRFSPRCPRRVLTGLCYRQLRGPISKAEPVFSNRLTRQIFIFFSYGFFFNSLIKHPFERLFFATKPADL